MLIDFSQIKEVKIPGMNDGTGEMSARMYMDEQGKIIPTTIHSGGSIGLHRHPTSDDINYVISGTGKAVCNGQEEILNAGTCHICKFPSRYNRTYSSGSSMASAFNAQFDPGVVFKSFSASQQSMRSI